ncbi:MAG: DUF2971 domain-containing protein [Anaerolineaceae bacterium]
MIPNELVHYTKRETAIERIMYEKRIQFNLLGKTNDPRETKSWYHPLFIPNELIDEGILRIPGRLISFTSPIHELVNEIIMKEWKVFCLTKHSNYNSKLAGPREFSKAYCHPRLWADYGGNHTGVCLIFNGKKLDQNIHNTLSQEYRIFHGSVEYNNLEAIGSYPIDVSRDSGLNREELREYFIKYYKEFFLKKTMDWKSEHEFRWLIHDNKGEPIYIPILGAIKGVIVGPDFPKVYEPTIIMLCKELNIFAGKLRWFSGMPRVNLTEIYSP